MEHFQKVMQNWDGLGYWGAILYKVVQATLDSVEKMWEPVDARAAEKEAVDNTRGTEQEQQADSSSSKVHVQGMGEGIGTPRTMDPVTQGTQQLDFSQGQFWSRLSVSIIWHS